MLNFYFPIYNYGGSVLDDIWRYLFFSLKFRGKRLRAMWYLADLLPSREPLSRLNLILWTFEDLKKLVYTESWCTSVSFSLLIAHSVSLGGLPLSRLNVILDFLTFLKTFRSCAVACRVWMHFCFILHLDRSFCFTWLLNDRFALVRCSSLEQLHCLPNRGPPDNEMPLKTQELRCSAKLAASEC